jgi:hypothetical protein
LAAPLIRNPKNVKSITLEAKGQAKNTFPNLIYSNTDSEDRPLTRKRRKNVKNNAKCDENNLTEHVKQTVLNDGANVNNSKDRLLKQSKSEKNGFVQNATKTMENDEFRSTKMAHEMEIWKNANGIEKEDHKNKKRDIRRRRRGRGRRIRRTEKQK